MKTRKMNQHAIILKVYCYTPICKPLNGSLPRSNASHMLRLNQYSYKYNFNGKKEKKEASSVLYFIKGIKGVLRHKIANICMSAGLDVCHSTDKEVDKHGNRLLPEGYHLLGSCVEKKECVLHQIFGSKGHEGIIVVQANPITSIPHKTAEISGRIQQVHIASENRVNLTYNGKSVQDFSERYFSGNFHFEIDVTSCTPLQLGLIIEGAMNFDRLGRGYNTGYGHVQVNKIQLLKRTVTRTPVMDENGCFIVQNQITEESRNKHFQNALEVWQNGINT
ncbi:hypothetical protein CEE45_09065 [Candidatus Heimdallarchaeota archaeon B3_Heim]|nr:MAG: hypothetical protein CEE45_09065 [Candidatus Heimdallarchaeota archaeon B3_Heim]